MAGKPRVFGATVVLFSSCFALFSRRSSPFSKRQGRACFDEPPVDLSGTLEWSGSMAVPTVDLTLTPCWIKSGGCVAGWGFETWAQTADGAARTDGAPQRMMNG